jgi:hypothetical protein
LRTVAVVPHADAIVEGVRTGAPSDEFLDLVVNCVRRAVRLVPSPSGVWTDDEIEEFAYEFLSEKWPKIALKSQALDTDRELRIWMRRVAVNYVNDQGRETPRGRFKHRIERVIGDLDDVRVEAGQVHGPGPAGLVSASDRDALLEPLWAIPTTTTWWAAAGDKDPTPGDRQDMITLIRYVVARADGAVGLDLLADVLAYRLNIPLGWSTGYLDYEVAETYLDEQDEIPPANREAAARLLARLNELELDALPVYVENPDVSTADLGRAIGRGKSTGHTVKTRLVAKLEAFADTDPEAEMALRAIARDVLAGRLERPDRSHSNGEEDNDVP